MRTAMLQTSTQGPLVSGITIFLNAEAFIQEAIESVLAQTYENWELILVDDGSTDGSTAIAKLYAQRYDGKIFYLEHPYHQNLGTGASRNFGVLHARGKYIGFLDADDVWLPNKLEHQVVSLQAHPEAAMVLGNTLYWQSWINNGVVNHTDYIPELQIPADCLIRPPKLLKMLLRGGGAVPCICGFLVERCAIEAVRGIDETFTHLYEDQVLLAKLFLTVPVFCESKYLEKYRQHPESVCHQASPQKEYNARKTFLIWLETQLARQEMESTELWEQLQKELWSYRHPSVYYLASRLTNLGYLMKDYLDPIVRRFLPQSVYSGLRDLWYGRPPVGLVNFGSFRTLKPISRDFGYERGLPIDRYYIENFLDRQKHDVQGRVLEVGESTYTRRYGDDRVSHRDVLYVIEGNPEATFVGDLTKADHIPSDLFDCIILTQTLHLIYDMKAAISTLHRILKPGGVLLATFPGISQIVKCDWGDSWCWALTAQSGRKLLEESFPAENVKVEAHGNVLTAISFLHGLAVKELQKKELDYQDSEYEVLITARAVKPSNPSTNSLNHVT